MDHVRALDVDRTDIIQKVTRRLIPFVTGRTIAPMFFRAAWGSVTLACKPRSSQGGWRRLLEQQRRSGSLDPA